MASGRAVRLMLLVSAIVGGFVFGRKGKDIITNSPRLLCRSLITSLDEGSHSYDGKCVELGHRGDCSFYECFERRHPCGTDGFGLKFGLYYCNRFKEMLYKFDQQGQDWIKQTGSCLSEKLLPLYRNDSYSCTEVMLVGIHTVSQCYIQTGFCDIFWSNKAALASIGDPQDLVSSSEEEIWAEARHVLAHCAKEKVTNLFSWAAKGIASLGV